MTPRERVIAAINFRKPDRVPSAIGFTPAMSAKMETYTGDKNYRRRLENHIAYSSLHKPQTEIEPGFFKDEFGVIWDKRGEDADTGVVSNKVLEDTEDLASYTFPPVDEEYIRSKMEKLCSERNAEKFRVAALELTLFERGWALRGMEDLLCDMLMEPEFVDELFDKITERILKMLDIALEYDIDGIYFTDDWGQQRGLIMGPDLWRRFIKPRMKKIYDRVHAADKYVVHHSCGDVRTIMDDMYEIGVNIYNSYQPEIYGYDYAEKLYGKITVWGGISTQRDLPCKTAEEIKEIVREMLRAFPNGGLIAAPTHTVPGDVPPENVFAIVEVLGEQQ